MKNENNKRHVEISYTVNAACAVVFEAWTNPDYLAKWFAPKGCTITYKKLEIKQGGTYHSCIHNPQFGDCWCIGIYKEIIANEKLVFTMVNADENGNPIDPASIGMNAEWPGETVVTVTFTEKDGKTTLTLYQTVSEELAKKTGAHPSWIQMMENLESFAMQKMN